MEIIIVGILLLIVLSFDIEHNSRMLRSRRRSYNKITEDYTYRHIVATLEAGGQVHPAAIAKILGVDEKYAADLSKELLEREYERRKSL